MKHFINQLRQHLGRLALLVGVFLLCGFTSRAWAITYSYDTDKLTLYGSGSETLTQSVLATAITERLNYCKEKYVNTYYYQYPHEIYIGAGISEIAANTFDALSSYTSLYILEDDTRSLQIDQNSLNWIWSLTTARPLVSNYSSYLNSSLWTTSCSNPTIQSLSFYGNGTADRWMFGATQVLSISFANNLFWSGLTFSTTYHLGIYFSGVQTLWFGDAVTSIPAYFFCNSSTLEKVDFHNGTCTVADNAFYNCPNVAISGIAPSSESTFAEWESFYNVSSTETSSATSIVIPNDNVAAHAWTTTDNLTTRFPNLQKITFLEDVTKVGNCICWESTHLYTVVFNNDNLTEIGNYAFLGCSSLSSIALPQNLTTIGYEAFTGCTSLKEVTIPSTVTSIGGLAFSNCSSLTATINSSSILNPSTAYTSSSNLSTSIFNKVPAIVIGDNITTIGTYAFYGATGLTSLTLGTRMATIGTNAFAGCTNLCDLTINSPKIAGKDYSTVSHLSEIFPNITSLTYGSSVTSLGMSSFWVAEGETFPLKTVTFEGTPEISELVFCNNTSLETVNGKIKSVANFSFYGCSKLKSITITDDDVIGANAFRNCTSLSSVTLPANLTNIGTYAFMDCSSLQAVTIPSTVTKFGDGAFRNCTSLTATINSNSILSSSYYASDNLNSIFGNVPSIVIGDDVTAIGQYAFYGAIGLTSLTLGSGLETIGVSAFEGCTSLTSPLTIGSSCTSIGEYAFMGTNITGIDLTKATQLKTIEGYTFCSCDGLTAVTIPSTVLSIEDYAFYGSDNLATATFDGSTTYEEHSFPENTIILSSITLDDKTSFNDWLTYYQIQSNYNLDKITELYIPNDNVADVEYNSDLCLSTLFPNLRVAKFGTEVTTIGDSFCSVCQNLESVVFNGDKVTTIKEMAFENCSRLESFTLPESVTTIGSKAFYKTGLLSVTIPKSVTSLAADAFDESEITELRIESPTIAAKDYSASSSTYLSISFPKVQKVTFGSAVTTLGRNIFQNLNSGTPGSTFPLSQVIFESENPVTVSYRAFEGCRNLSKVSGTIHNPGIGAFRSCKALTAITMDDATETIESGAFQYVGFTSVTLPSSLTTIGNGAFRYSALESATIPASVTTMGTDVFNDCSSLESVTIESAYLLNSLECSTTSNLSSCFAGVKNIILADNVIGVGSGYAFYGDTDLESLTLGANVTDPLAVAATAFNTCTKLKTLTIKAPDYAESERWNVNLTISTYFPNLTTVIFGENTTDVAQFMFASHANLKQVILKGGDKSIGESAFNECHTLQSVTGLFDNVGEYAFYGCSALETVGEESKPYTIGVSAFDQCYVLKQIPNTDNVTSIGESAFSSCEALTSVVISDNVTTIGATAFSGCTSLASVTIGKSVTSIGDDAFTTCTALTDVTINSPTLAGTDYERQNFMSQLKYTTDLTFGPEVTRIGNHAVNILYNVATTSVQNVTFQYDGVEIGDWAFAGNKTLVSVNGKICNVGAKGFSECYKLTSITIDDAATTIGESAFSSCKSLSSITLGENVTTIGTNAFKDCTALTDVTINSPTIASPSTAYSTTSNLGTLFPYITTVTYGDKVTDIGQCSFYNYSALQTVNIVGDAKNVWWRAFSGCKNLETVNGAGVKLCNNNSNKYTFASCEKLKEITIAEGSTAIPEYAFYGCYALTDIVVPEGVESIGERAFYNCTHITDFTLPGTLSEIGSNAFAGCLKLTSVTNNSTDPQSLTESDQFNGVTLSNATLYVPDASVEDYAEATVWKDFNIRGINWVDLTDGTAYERTEPLESGRVTYTRTFNNTSWQSLYIPFSMDYDEWKDRFDVAYINGIRQYDDDEDGKIDNWTMDVVYIKDGALYPNTPYLIKAHSTTSDPVIVENKTLYPAESNSIDCSTTIMRYIFVGTYTQMTQTELEEENAYIMGGGKLGRPSSSGLKPYRWYLSVESKDPMYDAYTSVESIRIRVVGEDGEPEGIEDVVSDTNQEIPAYDLMGRRTEKSHKGFQVNNGVKVINL